MRVFFDTNILLNTVLNEEGSAASLLCVIHCSTGVHQGWVAWHTLSNAHYIARSRGKSKEQATEMVADLLKWAEIAEITKTDANAALSYEMRDFEDALQLAAAVACGADVLLTRNTKDFKASPLPVMTPEAFLAAYPTPF